MAGRSGAGKVRAAQIRNTNITAAARSSRSRSRRRRPPQRPGKQAHKKKAGRRPGQVRRSEPSEGGTCRTQWEGTSDTPDMAPTERNSIPRLVPGQTGAWSHGRRVGTVSIPSSGPAAFAFRTAGCAHRRSGRLAIAIACKKIHYTCIFMEARIRMAGARSFFAAITAHFCRTTTPCGCDVAPPACLSRRERLALVLAAVGNCADQCPACALWALEQDERQERPVPDPARTTFERRPSC